ncbi:MAG: hypothetical protein WC069_06605 [Candidatus Shapirobacteria bacterium]
MLRIRVILIFTLLGQLVLNAQTFDVSIDTMFVDIKEIASPASRIVLTHAVKYNDKYYCFFEERGLYFHKIETKYFLVISSKGEILNNIEVPKEIENSVYFDFFIRNENLYAKTYTDSKCFKFNLNKLKWTKIKELDDRVYEDSNFVITYLDFGEWGQTTKFLDKQTKKKYGLDVYGTIVNYYNNKYYLTNGCRIIEVADPRKLKQVKINRFGRLFRKRMAIDERPEYPISSEVFFNDTLCSSHPRFTLEKPKRFIITSFVSDNQFYQLYSDSNSTYIGKIENHNLIPIQNLVKKYQTFDWHYSYRGNNLKNESRFIKFREDNNTFGFLEINSFNLNINYLIHNQDSLKYVGSDGFEDLFTFFVNTDKISIFQADSIEYKNGGIDMRDDGTVISYSGYHLEKYKEEEIKYKRYVKVIDDYIAETTEYLYSNENKIVPSIIIEWTLTEHYNQTYNISLSFDENPETVKRFINKFKQIEELITDHYMTKPLKESTYDENFKLTWTFKDKIAIRLFGSETFKGKKEITMIISKE